MRPNAGMLLIASQDLADPNFLRTVIYLVEHGDDGTLGFIVNRPLEIPLKDLWGDCPACLADTRIAAEGGPVERNKGLLLHGCPDLTGAQPMGPGLAVGGDLDALAERYARGDDTTGPRLYLGHSGWSPGQLDRELEEGTWLLRPGRPDFAIAPPDPLTLWQFLVTGHHGLTEPSVN